MLRICFPSEFSNIRKTSISRVNAYERLRMLGDDTAIIGNRW